MIFGADISTLAEVERLGGRFRDAGGRERALLPILADNGFTGVRLRLWNDPYAEDGAPYGAGGCDLPCVTGLAQRAADAGMALLLDLHYSDFWCDPARQIPPKAWAGLPLDALCQAVYTFTRDTLIALRKAGVSPRFVQPGNEITGGMLWPAGRLDGSEESFSHLAALLSSATRAIREESDAAILMHLERSWDAACYRTWFDEMDAHGVPFDIIGASYYPVWHGGFDMLTENLAALIRRYGRDVMIAETAYPFTVAHYDTAETHVRLAIDADTRMSDGSALPYPATPDGQKAYLAELIRRIDALPEHHGAGIWYWEPAWLPVPGSTWASEAARKYISEEWKRGGNEWANQCLFDYSGQALPALSVFRNS